ncbi:hypothetical protein ABZX01_003785 [Vibrio vulnificus]
MFEAILNTQGQALERLMTNQPTVNPSLMEEEKQKLEESIVMAIQASKEVAHGDIQA